MTATAESTSRVAPGLVLADPLAFRQVYDAHFEHVWLSLKRLGVPPADLDDATQEVFITLHRRLADYDPSRPIRAWLTGIAYRAASHARRRMRTRRESAVEVPDVVDRAPGPERSLASKQALALVYEALQSLDLDKRVVFIMHDIDGVPMPEIAQALEAPLNTCYSRLRLGRRRFEDAVGRIHARRGVT